MPTKVDDPEEALRRTVSLSSGSALICVSTAKTCKAGVPLPQIFETGTRHAAQRFDLPVVCGAKRDLPAEIRVWVSWAFAPQRLS